MNSLDITKEKFDEISKTGYQVVVLRDVGTCDCVSKTETNAPADNVLIPKLDILEVVEDIEIADPECTKCLGTGKKMFPILTNKIRVTSSSGGLSGESKNLEVQLMELIKNDFLNFYFPYNYEFLTLKDYIALVKMDSKNNVIFPIQYTDIYKIANIEVYVRNEFKYYKVSGNKKKVI